MNRSSVRPLPAPAVGPSAFLALGGLVLVACTAGPDGRGQGEGPPPDAPADVAIRSWGTLREALRDGETGTRVDVVEVAEPGMFAVGAATGLRGEITVVAGEILHTFVTPDGEPRTRDGRDGPVEATMLFAATVAGWQSFEVAEDVGAADVAGLVAAEASARGIDVERPFPFRVEGGLLGLRCHVMRGQCPVRARMLGVEMETPPFEVFRTEVEGQVVGVFARDAGGKLTHHGESMHAHAVLPEGAGRITGHVESFGIAAGARVYLPVR